MELSPISGTDLYIPTGTSPNAAVFAFLPTQNVVALVLLTTTWVKAQGYYVFFPAANRGDWTAFAAVLRKTMAGIASARLGWFDGDGKTRGVLSVVGTDNPQTLSAGSNFVVRNLTLGIATVSGKAVNVALDGTTFTIDNVSGSFLDSVVLSAKPAGSNAGLRFIKPIGKLRIPLDGPTPGVFAADFELSLADQAALETGPMYFAPPADEADLTALRYQTFLAAQGGVKPLGITAYFDPSVPGDGTRTYFELTDALVGTTFVTATGRQVMLAPLPAGQDPDGVSARLVLSNRPVQEVGQESAFYLTPHGSFTVSLSGSEGLEAAVDGPGEQVLCAYSATEAFSITRGDVMRFQPGQPAFYDADGARAALLGGATPQYLQATVTTSWVELRSSAAQNVYFSQPQTSPMYESRGKTGGGGTLANRLELMQIQAWPPQGSAAAESGPIPTGLVPMVPYGGVPTKLPAEVQLYQRMETQAINPARRQALKGQAGGSFERKAAAATSTAGVTDAMTPLGLLGGFDAQQQWVSTKFAISGAQQDQVLQFELMGDELRAALLQSQIFVVIDRNTIDTRKLFQFDKGDATVELAEWFFDLSLIGQDPQGVPPILILKLFRDKSVKELVEELASWESPQVFSSSPEARQRQIECIFCQAEEAVEADPTSPYANFVEKINDPSFAGLLGLNCALQLDKLPAPIRALLGGMTKDDQTSNIAAFRAHHVGVQINDTADDDTVSLSSSSLFALVDYQVEPAASACVTCKPAGGAGLAPDRATPAEPVARGTSGGLEYYGFKVVFLRALFSNSALSEFTAEIDLTVNNLFAVGVNLGSQQARAADDDNIIKITGSYSNHDGAQAYSFIAEKTYEFTFDDNRFLKQISFDKVQFSATEDENTSATGDGGTKSTITSRFSIWGSLEFNELNFLDMFSFEKLSFAELGIGMSYDLTVYPGGRSPVTTPPALAFHPGNLRLDLADSKTRDGDNSMLALLPFKLKSFLYSEQGQDISALDYFGIDIDIGESGVDTDPSYNFALVFDLDLGSLGGLVSALSAFKLSILLGWQPPTGKTPNALVFGVKLPEADGKLEINIQGVLKISIQQFVLRYTDGDTPMLVLAMHNSYMEVLGTRMPPGNIVFDLALFAPTKGDDKIGWIAALNDSDPPPLAGAKVADGPLAAVKELRRGRPVPAVVRAANAGGLFKLDYIGVGQRVGPDPDTQPTNFQEFLKYMREGFWTAVKDEDYTSVYQPAGGWIVVASFELLQAIGMGFVFYDTTPFYALTVYVTKDPLTGLSFEITYTKVNDDIGLFFINFSLPDQLRTFEAGAASITLPALKLSIYTNGDFKVDLGFPTDDDWSGSFRVEAFAGPVPVTGSGGFYIAKRSSATDNTFKRTDYDTILAAGLGARLGVGKNFTAGPLKAGVSLTFFGIIEGALGYFAYEQSGSRDIVSWLTSPRALALKGQFGVIGELYGTLDFAIISASVNVRILASVGVELMLEEGLGGDILLYVEASVQASVSLKIKLGFFSIRISFSFTASFRFEWKLLGSGDRASVAALAAAPPWNPAFPLQAGLAGGLSTWMTPELTSVWTDVTANGTPWFVTSLTMEYVDAVDTVRSTADFKSLETIVAQMLAWALNAALGLASWAEEVTVEQLDQLNQDPEALVGGLGYATLIDGLARMFTLAIESVSPAAGVPDDDETTKYATVFPMLPFLGLEVAGRTPNLPAYTFADKSRVSQQWVDTQLRAYFEQLYVNIFSEPKTAAQAAQDTDVALSEVLFLDWFKAAIRAGINGLVTQMQNDGTAHGKVQDVYLAAVKSGQIKNVAGQMSQFFRSGVRLPQTQGMELPDGAPLAATNPLYALTWQEFPVGSFDAGGKYTVTLTPDAGQPWVTVDAKWELLESDVTPYAIKGTSLSLPVNPQAVPVLQRGSRAFALTNAISWTQDGAAAGSLRPVGAAMVDALAAKSPLSLAVRSRRTDRSFDDDVTQVPAGDVTWALAVEMVVRKVPVSGGKFLADTYAIGSTAVSTQNLMRALLAVLGGNRGLVTHIDLLHQTAPGQAGLVSVAAPEQLFVLRTNTTTQSVPPPELLASGVGDRATAVGADTSDPFGFLQILEQASVTNQTGYFLTYRAGGAGLPDALFGQQTFAPVTFLFRLAVPVQAGVFAVPGYVNATLLQDPAADLLYFAETTDASDQTSYVAVAAGAAGVALSRPEPGEGTVAQQLAQLYSLVSFQVPASSGFIASNLSVPVGPQRRDADDPTQTWRLFVPLYNLAQANQGASVPNRYASIGEQYSLEALVVDAFGNGFGSPSTVVGNRANLYFDDLIGLGNWTGIRTQFDFRSRPDLASGCADDRGGDPVPGQLCVRLCPNKQTLPKPGTPSAAATAALYTTIRDQLTGPGVALFVTTNLDSTQSEIPLSQAQSAAVVEMITTILRYLGGESVVLIGVSLTVSVPGSAEQMPLVFQLQVNFVIRRDAAFVDPAAADHPGARVVVNGVAPRDTNDLASFAADFSAAFPAFSMATGPADAAGVVVADPRALGAEADDASGGRPKGLWAVSRKVTALNLGATRHYLAPRPLDTSLRSGTVPMPRDLAALKTLPDQRTFSDVDLDVLARSTFAAIDAALAAGSASNTFITDSDAYTAIAYAREDIAARYADHEVDWLLDAPAYIGDPQDLCQGRDQMEQQMRAALGSAYAIDTLVQTKVVFSQPLPASMDNRLQLFGQMQRRVGAVNDRADAGGFGLSTARVDVPAGAGGQAATMTFWYGVRDATLPSRSYEQLDLEWAVTHLQVFLEKRELDDCRREDQAPPSIWLQLINAFASPPALGQTIIPLPLREYPTPPTAVVQSAKSDIPANPQSLAEQTRWKYTTVYQARLLAADEITLQLSYNVGAGQRSAQLRAGAGGYDLFQALTRFQAGYELLAPQMTPITKDTPKDVLDAFATLVTQLANNTDWTDDAALQAATGPSFVLEKNVVTDKAGDGRARTITLAVDPSSEAQVGIKTVYALDPSKMTPYENQQARPSSGSQPAVTTYTPAAPLAGEFVTHKVEVTGLTTLSYENGKSGLGIRRNAALYPDATVLSRSEFVYQTPIVSYTNPVTPFVDNAKPVQIYPTIVGTVGQDLGDYVYATLAAMMGLGEVQLGEAVAGQSSHRRLKIEARFGFPIGAPSGLDTTNETDFLPLNAAVLVRSFDLPIDGLAEALKNWVGAAGSSADPPPYAAAVARWLAGNGLGLGVDAAPAGAMVVFDVTLYSQLSDDKAPQLPLLRLSQLRLKLANVGQPRARVSAHGDPGDDNMKELMSGNYENALSSPGRLKNSENDNWDGSPLVLKSNQQVTVATTNNALVLAYLNEARTNDDGTLVLAWGGSHQALTARAQVGLPQIFTQGYDRTSLRITNTSEVPIRIILIGPGFAPATRPLPDNGAYQGLEVFEGRQTAAPSSLAQLSMRNSGGDATVFVYYVASTPAVVAVNWSGAKPDGYAEVTATSKIDKIDNWLGSTLFVTNVSPSTSNGAQVALRRL